MEKNKSSLLNAILGGAVACFFCMGLVFMYTSNGTKNLKGNEELSNQQEYIDYGDDTEEEILLGDTCVNTQYTYCSTGTKIGEYCYSAPIS